MIRLALLLLLFSCAADAQMTLTGVGQSSGSVGPTACTQNLVLDYFTATGTPPAYACDIVSYMVLGL